MYVYTYIYDQSDSIDPGNFSLFIFYKQIWDISEVLPKTVDIYSGMISTSSVTFGLALKALQRSESSPNQSQCVEDLSLTESLRSEDKCFMDG